MSKSAPTQKTIIFDLDGTIADSLGLIRELWNEFALESGFQTLTHEEELMLRGKSVKEIRHYLKVRWYQTPGIISKVTKQIHTKIHEIRMMPGMTDLLKTLKSHCRLGILSTNSPANIELFIKTHRLEYFDFIHSQPRLSGKAKGLKKVLKDYEINLDEAVYVGDEIRDSIAAHNAGIKAVSVSWGMNTKELLEKSNPGGVVDTPEELKAALFNFLKK